MPGIPPLCRISPIELLPENLLPKKFSQWEVPPPKNFIYFPMKILYANSGQIA
jgi:hypothetical protein